VARIRDFWYSPLSVGYGHVYLLVDKQSYQKVPESEKNRCIADEAEDGFMKLWLMELSRWDEYLIRVLLKDRLTNILRVQEPKDLEIEVLKTMKLIHKIKEMGIK